ncbi:hypothetical protein ABD76_13515 [Paenibacillus dendritiformis]|uniref:hypothetical protein n=1 Tax=Paenibacillus dendritiformis TaxID=130049 RepID=UPI0018CE27FE|nr:hypothetical protein [Paenibacillus dendritiformis]MBG9793449.1 hypothetical protein [Paenibacillus dendritiformis]
MRSNTSKIPQTGNIGFTGGNALAGDSFNVSDNGVYTVYAKDQAGNEAVATITIANIYRQPPRLTLTRSPDTWTNQPVTISVAIGTDQGIAVKLKKWARGKHPSGYFQEDGEAAVVLTKLRAKSK